MIPLVTKTDLADYKFIADSTRNNAMWNQMVVEAQQFDVKHWLGDALLNDIVEEMSASPAELSAANQKLMDGGSYTYQNKVYTFMGLKSCIIYFAFSRFVSKNPYNFTAAGITVKDTDFSTPASDKAIQRIATENLLNAASIKEDVTLFLRRNSTTYPLFKCSNTATRPRTFFVIGD